MQKKSITITSFIIIFCSILLLGSCKKESNQFQRKIFELDKISTESIEYSPTFSSSGLEIYFSKSDDKWGMGDIRSSIYHSVKENQKWSKPKLASFSGKYDDSAPFLTKNGKTMYFISRRPSEGILHNSQDIWKVERNENNKWGTPIRLENPINSSENEYCLRTDKYGNLYFASDRKGGLGQGDLYMVEKINNHYGPPQNLGATLNSKKGEWNLEVNKEGDLIIFEASERRQNLSPYGDLYISFKLNNKWSLPQNIQEINTTGSDLYPELVDDVNILYFSSSDSLKSTQTNIYFIRFKNIYDKYRKTAVFSE